MDSNTSSSGAGEIAETMIYQLGPLDKWAPAVGPEATDLINHVSIPDESRDVLQKEAVSVLAKCVPPTQPMGNETGLVIGYVQSGKTMSFTTVSALGRDNNFQMVIVITGTSRPLFNQSTDRLTSDLRLDDRNDRNWLHYANPRPASRTAIRDALAEWHDASVPAEERRTVLITVMKNVRHLASLNALLSGLDMRGVATLIIDDEADQAGLNTGVQNNNQSPTYSQLLTLRQNLPQHSFRY